MLTIEQCQTYAAEYQTLVIERTISVRRATVLMGISHSWSVLADHLERLADIVEEEGK